ncbi:MAG: alanine racemase-like [Chloroflexi bacterium]|nr:alanine racemase-like [Chloroflexota bacterium]
MNGGRRFIPADIDTPALVVDLDIVDANNRRLGEVVAIVPNHVCPVVDLFDSCITVRGESIVGTWPVDARGRSG